MLRSHDVPVFSYEYSRRDDFLLPARVTYVFGESIEQRSHLPEEWSKAQDADFVQISEEEYRNFAFIAQGRRFQLRSEEQVEAFLDSICEVDRPLYIDITGLSHHVWVPVVARLFGRILRKISIPSIYVVYVEPRDYRKSTIPRPGDIFALSEKCHGIRPLPGMLRLRRRYLDANVLVALVGFEGWRFDAILAAFEPHAGTVIPIIGVPGYRAEYPFYTVEGNYLPLDKDDNWTRREFARASDPFEVFEILFRLASESLGVRVAMVGTKPHSLGAVLFAAALPDLGELIYDNPVRSSGRTDEARRVQVYDISSFAEALPLLGYHHSLGDVI